VEVGEAATKPGGGAGLLLLSRGAPVPKIRQSPVKVAGVGEPGVVSLALLKGKGLLRPIEQGVELVITSSLGAALAERFIVSKVEKMAIGDDGVLLGVGIAWGNQEHGVASVWVVRFFFIKGGGAGVGISFI
jgi:hypothetical protein